MPVRGECPVECGGGCKSYLGNAQMPVTLFIMVLPLGWSVLKDWCVDHPPGADRTTCPVRTGPRVQMGRYVQSIYRGPVCVIGRRTIVGSRIPGPWGQVGPDRVENLKYLSGTGVRSRSKKLSGAGVPPKEKKKLSLERTTCLADKTNHPVERLSLNRSQCGSCSTKYDTSAGT